MNYDIVQTYRVGVGSTRGKMCELSQSVCLPLRLKSKWALRMNSKCKRSYLGLDGMTGYFAFARRAIASLVFTLPFMSAPYAYAQSNFTFNGTAQADCSDAPILGRVFLDKNKNGYADKGEIGVSGAKLYTPQGLRITTDENGKFHIACPDTPPQSIGSNVLVKLDEASLPAGYHVTSENPRVIRMTPSQIGKVNFGIAQDRVISIDLSDEAFETGSLRLKSGYSNQLLQTIDHYKSQNAIFRINYYGPTPIGEARLKTLDADIRNLWHQYGGKHSLNIERKQFHE